MSFTSLDKMQHFLRRRYGHIYPFIQEHIGFFIAVCISVYGVYLRVYGLDIQSFRIDEGFSSISTLHMSQWTYYLHNIAQYISFQILGVSDFSARLPSVFFSLMNIPIIYLLAKHIFNSKKVAYISVILFSLMPGEIIWARQARFYTVLQFIFSLQFLCCAKFFFAQDTRRRIIYFFINVFLLIVGAYFHPFLWMSILIFLVTVFVVLYKYSKQYIKINNMLLLLGVVCISVLGWFFTDYFLFNFPSEYNYGDGFEYMHIYLSHLREQFGYILILFGLGCFIHLKKGGYIRHLLFIIPICFFLIVSHKIHLYHTRYMFMIYPLIILGGSYVIVYIYDMLSSIYLKMVYSAFIVVLSLYMGLIVLTPKVEYFIDYTSPQPDFKGAYHQIPQGSKVISGFSTLCKWYYADTGDCLFHLPMNDKMTAGDSADIIARGFDPYTNIPHLLSTKQLEEGTVYYVVLDNLTDRAIIDRDVLNGLLEQGDVIFLDGENHNRIAVIKVIW